MGYPVRRMNRKHYPCQDLHFFHHKNWEIAGLLPSLPFFFFSPLPFIFSKHLAFQHLSTPRLAAFVLPATP